MELTAGELDWSLLVTVTTWPGDTGEATVTVCSIRFWRLRCFEVGESELLEAGSFSFAGASCLRSFR